MSFYRPEWSKKLEFPALRLNIGSYCSLCLGRSESEIDICDACESLLKRCLHTDRSGRTTQVCLQCGIEQPSQVFGADRSQGTDNAESKRWSSDGCCRECRRDGSVFSRIIAPYRYSFPLDKLIRVLKYRENRQIGRVLGCLLARSVRSRQGDQGLPDYLLPMPLHPDRQASRGYNQASDLARWCARELGLVSWPGGACRIVDTGSLAGLSRAERQYRILGAFRADQAVQGKRIAIVDDVLTTGSTSRELARELYDTGAESVELWVLARTSNDL
ncbi:MAG: ComF family protein [Granulosicoccus sp.]